MWHEMATRRVLGQDGFIREVCIWARSGCNCRALEAWWQNLHRTHVVTVRQRQRLCTESIAECGMGRQRVGKTGKSYGVPMEYVWNTYGTTRSQHARSTPTAGLVIAGSAGAARRVLGEAPEFKRLPKLAGSGGIRRVGRAPQEGGSEGKDPGQRLYLGAGRHSRLQLLG